MMGMTRLAGLGAAALLAFAGTQAAAAPDEIRVGHVGPKTGWASIFGQRVLNGVKLAIDQAGGEVEGIPIELISEDTKADVEVMVTKLDSLKNRDDVHLVIGPSLGNEGMAAVDWAKRNPEMPILVGYSAPEDMTMRKARRNVIRPGWTGSQVIFHFGRFVAKQLDYDRVIVVGQDYSFPWDQAAGFIRGFLENGGQEVNRIWHPVDAVDFSSIMARLRGMANEYDAVLYNGGGAQVVAFHKQWHEFGMESVYPKLLGAANVPIVPTLPELGEKAVGMYSSLHYADGRMSEANETFREDYKAKFGHYPGAIAMQGYDAMRVALKAIRAIDGDVEDSEAFIDAALDVEMSNAESPRGPFHFDEFGHATQNIYIKQVVKRDGQLRNKVVKTYEDVSQFGPYEGMADKYMGQPATTRSYPPGTREAYMAELEKHFGADYVEMLKQHDGWPMEQ